MSEPALSATSTTGTDIDGQRPPIPHWPGHRFLEHHDRPDETTIIAETIHGGHRIAAKHVLDRTQTEQTKLDPVPAAKDHLAYELAQFIHRAKDTDHE